MAIEQWRFFSVPHLLWHGASVYNGHLRRPVTLSPYLGGPVTLPSPAERVAVELSLPVFTTKICRGWDSNTKPAACGTNALTHCATAAASIGSKQLDQFANEETDRKTTYDTTWWSMKNINANTQYGTCFITITGRSLSTSSVNQRKSNKSELLKISYWS